MESFTNVSSQIQGSNMDKEKLLLIVSIYTRIREIFSGSNIA